jgi:hypothetical protein
MAKRWFELGKVLDLVVVVHALDSTPQIFPLIYLALLNDQEDAR